MLKTKLTKFQKIGLFVFIIGLLVTATFFFNSKEIEAKAWTGGKSAEPSYSTHFRLTQKAAEPTNKERLKA